MHVINVMYQSRRALAKLCTARWVVGLRTAGWRATAARASSPMTKDTASVSFYSNFN